MKSRGSLSIAWREGKSLFDSPGGFVILGTFWLVAGLLLVTLLFQFRETSLRIAQSAEMRTQAVGAHVNDWVVRPLLYNVGMVLIFFVPLLTMRTFAEERRTGSLELLMSLPLRGGQILLGKFLGALLGLCFLCSIFIVHGVILALLSRPDWGATLAGILGVALLGLFFTSVGILLSVLSRTQVEAAVLSLGALLLFTIGSNAGAGGHGVVASILGYLSVLARFEDFTRGIIDLGHVAFFLGASFFFLALALRSLDLLRWQG